MRKIMILTVVLFGLFAVLSAGKDTGLHKTWDTLLQTYVKNGHVNYKGFARDVKQLNAYLDTLDKTDISSFPREEKLAYWINAYNAYTVKLILNHYPIKSIRKISRPWKQRICKTAGKTLSLDHIEHKILRKELKEPRIHFAIVCASIGCPDLQSFAFTGERVNEQLDHAAARFFASRKHFYFETDGDKVKIYISKIFSWFGDDFGDNKELKVNFILRYLEKPDAEKIKKAGSVRMKYLSYDWNLNEDRGAATL